MSLLLLTPLGPVAVLAGGAMLLMPVNVRRLPRVVQVLALLATGIAWVWTLALRASPAPVEAVWPLITPIHHPLHFLLRLDSTTWPLAALVTTVGFGGALLLSPHPPVGRVSGPTAGLLLVAGALGMVMAANLLTLVAGWWLMDAAYLALLVEEGRAGAGRTVGLSLVGLLVLWMVLTGVGPEAATLPWNLTSFSGWTVGLMGLSVWLRLGVYPLHRPVVWTTPGMPWPWLWLDGVAGGAWFLRWASLANAAAIWNTPLWLALGVFAVLGSSLAAWVTRLSHRRLTWVLINRASTLVLVTVLGVGNLQGATWALVAAFALAGAALLVLQDGPRARGQHLLWGLAALTLWGAPLTLGAPMRAVLAHVWTHGRLLGSGMLLADTLALAALWFPLPGIPSRNRDSGVAGTSPSPLQRIGIPGLPRRRNPHYGAAPAAARALFFLMPALLVGGISRWGLSHLPPGTWAWTTLVPLALAALLVWQRERIFVDVREWEWGLGVLARLEPLEALARRAAAWILTGMGGLLYLVEGAGWLGWLLLAGLLAVVWRYLPPGG